MRMPFARLLISSHQTLAGSKFCKGAKGFERSRVVCSKLCVKEMADDKRSPATGKYGL